MKTLDQVVGYGLPTQTMKSVGVRKQHVGACATHVIHFDFDAVSRCDFHDVVLTVSRQ